VSFETQLNPPEIPNRTAAEMNRLGQATGSRGLQFGSVAEAAAGLAERLFRAPERWGWEYVEPSALVPYPYLDQYPQWVEPWSPDFSEHEKKLAVAKADLPLRLAGAGLAGFLGLLSMGWSVRMGWSAGVLGVVFLLIGAAIAAYAIYQPNVRQSALREAKQETGRRRDAGYANFLDVTRVWDEQIAQYNAMEQHRYATEPLLFPLAPGGFASRVDVFGGISTGWASLLATTGSSVLAAGSTVLVLDLSGQNVAGPLSDLARMVDAPVQSAAVPAALEARWLLGDLTPRELADVLAEAMDSMRGKHDNVDLGAMDAEIIHTVARRLERPLTFGRLAAGMRVLRSTYDPDEEMVLSAIEVQRLTERVDVIDKGERMRDELRFVETQLGVLSASERQADAAGTTASSLWPSRGLAVLGSDEQNLRRKGFIDRVLFQAVAHHLATTRVRAADPILVVAGADELGRSSLEAMARNAFKAQVRLVYLFEHLRDDAADLLGGGDSVAVLMRLGNGREAAAAAEYIGRGFTFQLSQLSRQVGTNSSETRSTSTTESESHAVTNTVGGSSSQNWGGSSSRSWGHGGGGGSAGSNWGRSVSDTWSDAVMKSWSTSWQEGKSFSEGRSATDGAVLQRSYEFTVEPTQLQTLDPTTFLLVDSGPQGRRVRMGDCFPGAVFVPRTSRTSR
jgi:hypothetical protein